MDVPLRHHQRQRSLQPLSLLRKQQQHKLQHQTPTVVHHIPEVLPLTPEVLLLTPEVRPSKQLLLRPHHPLANAKMGQRGLLAPTDIAIVHRKLRSMCVYMTKNLLVF